MLTLVDELRIAIENNDAKRLAQLIWYKPELSNRLLDGCNLLDLTARPGSESLFEVVVGLTPSAYLPNHLFLPTFTKDLPLSLQGVLKKTKGEIESDICKKYNLYAQWGIGEPILYQYPAQPINTQEDVKSVITLRPHST